MSELIKKYKCPKQWFKDSKELTLTTVAGGKRYGSSIQFTIGYEFIVLSQSQLSDLILVVSRHIEDKQWIAVEDCVLKEDIKKLKESIKDLYHQLGKAEVWNASNDTVCDMCEELVIKKIEELEGVRK